MNASGDRILAFAEFEMDTGIRRLTRDGETIALHSKAFDLLEYFVDNSGRVLSKDELLEQVWDGKFVEESNLAVQISNLRKALGDSKNDARFLVTVPGKGYKFAAGLQHSVVVTEQHSISEITIEHEEEFEQHYSQPLALKAKSSRMPLYGAVAAFAVMTVAVLGYFGYQRQSAASTMSAPWLEPAKKVQRRQLTANGRVNVAAISPDGTLVAYTNEGSEQSGMWVIGINSSQTVEVLAPAQRTFYGLTFSPDGAYIYYSTRDERDLSGALYRVPKLGGLAEKVLTNIETPITFSPDGSEFAFLRNIPGKDKVAIIAAKVNGPTTERIIAENPTGGKFSMSGISWSPDGTKIATGGNLADIKDQVVLIVNTANGAVERLGEGTWNGVRRVEWMPDGTGLYVNAIDKKYWQERQITLLEYPSGREHRITNDLNRYGAETVDVSADGTKMVGVSAQTVSNIFVTDADDMVSFQQITQNALGKNDGNWNSLTWTPDDKLVLMRFFDKSDTLWIMDADGTNEGQRTNSGFLDRKPVVTRDGRTVVFQSNRSGRNNVWRMNINGTDQRQLTEHGGGFPSLSADDQLVYFQMGSFIARVSINGGTPEKLTSKPSRGVDVSPDGKYFATFYRAAANERLKLAIFPIGGGEPVHLFDAAADLPWEKMRWTPDSKAVVYCFYNSTAWKQNISGGAAEKFLEFPGEIINAFDWSRDGKRFAVAHGQELRDVVLFSVSK